MCCILLSVPTEQVRLALTAGPQQAALHLNLAQERLVELRTLAERREVPTNLLTEISVETACCTSAEFHHCRQNNSRYC